MIGLNAALLKNQRLQSLVFRNRCTHERAHYSPRAHDLAVLAAEFEFSSAGDTLKETIVAAHAQVAIATH